MSLLTALGASSLHSNDQSDQYSIAQCAAAAAAATAAATAVNAEAIVRKKIPVWE